MTLEPLKVTPGCQKWRDSKDHGAVQLASD